MWNPRETVRSILGKTVRSVLETDKIVLNVQLCGTPERQYDQFSAKQYGRFCTLRVRQIKEIVDMHSLLWLMKGSSKNVECPIVWNHREKVRSNLGKTVLPVLFAQSETDDSHRQTTKF